mmetsp:Transcript_81133/g.143734  ORF Transcript_81133/g.143734 Transcript_81133/m.143734 type:complete len:244 (-) Transcript_81133:1169-1900(-)
MPVCSCIVALDPHRWSLHKPVCSCAIVGEMIACSFVCIERKNVGIAISNARSSYGIAGTADRLGCCWVNIGRSVTRVVLALIMRDPVHSCSRCRWLQELCTAAETMGKCCARTASGLLVPTHVLISAVLVQKAAMWPIGAPCTQSQWRRRTSSPTAVGGFVVDLVVPLALLQARRNDALVPSSGARMREREEIASTAERPLLIWVDRGGGCSWHSVRAKVNKIRLSTKDEIPASLVRGPHTSD